MKRRDFLKYIGIGAGGAGLGYVFGSASKPPGAKLIPYLIPPEDIVPGVATWYASLCTQCNAGCGTLVKIMEGRVKKIEGNPLHPVNKGKLCALGQTAPQEVYNPDRIKGPLKRKGERGSGVYEEITWEEGLSALAKNLSALQKNNDTDKLFFLSSPMRGHRSTLVNNFMAAFGSAKCLGYELFDNRNLLYANRASMGLGSLPHYDIANTRMLLSFGAELSTWVSPVNYSQGYGQMRQGNAKRGRLVQVEPRLSLTGANADEWVPARPGTEAALALAIAYAIVEKGLYKGADAGAWRSALSRYRPKDVAKLTDVDEERIYRIAGEFAGESPSLAIGGDSVSSYDNGVASLVAINVLNHLAGNIGVKGGVVPNQAKEAQERARITEILAGAGTKVKTLLVYNTNPVFATPKAAKAEEGFAKIPFIASFSSFMDETTAMADIILPAHVPLEDWGDDYADPAVGFSVATLNQPVVSPVHKTMGLGDIFISLGKALGGRVKDRLPSGTFEQYLKDSWKAQYTKSREMSAKASTFEEFWNQALQQGGWWPGNEQKAKASGVSPRSVEAYIQTGQAGFAGNEKEFPLYLTLYPHAGLNDGRGANRPWLQELPDPMTSIVWGSWVEINPKTAGDLGILNNEMVVVESPYGKIKAPAHLNPGIRPDTVSIPLGQGHRHYGRYAKDRGVNPIEILPFKEDPRTGAVALNSTRVKLRGTGEPGAIASFAGSTRELGKGIVQTVSPKEFERMKKEEV